MRPLAHEDFNELLTFLTVATERSFTRAAATLGRSQSTISHTIRRLESRLGLRLLTRTTRSVAPTEAGERLFKTMAPRIAEIEAEIAALTELREKPSGTVRITAGDYSYNEVLWPRLAKVLDDYPDIRLEVATDASFRNIVEERFDAGVRLGESVEKDMIAVRIGPDWRLVVVGSPRYFGARTRPLHPRDLVGHDCINLRMLTYGNIYAWEFEKDGQELKVSVEGRLTFNSTYPIAAAAVAGYGLGFVPESLVEADVAAGRLERVLNDWCPFFPGFHLYYPSRRQLSPAFSAVVDALRYRGPIRP
jgi:DNA-binding transcriptional LysR family regulator